MPDASIAFGLLLDRVVPEPATPWHPVAWFGTAMGALESALWADSRRRGVAYAATGTLVAAAVGAHVRHPTPVVLIAVAGSELRRIGSEIGSLADSGDLEAARAELPSLVGRDPSELDASGIAAAAIESLAENAVDAVVAPVFWGAVAGAPGAAAYRAVNTMDAMVGHRSMRYRNFGWAAARLDDAANWFPSRLFALLVAAAAPSRARQIAHAVRSDAPAHPSPNAGVAEAAVAAAIGRQLGGTLRYGDRVEHRPTLGAGPRPDPADVDQVARLTSRIEWMMSAALLLPTACRFWRSRTRR